MAHNDVYRSLMRKPLPRLEKKVNKEVIIEMVSCMCDNRSCIRLKKNADGEFKINTISRTGGFPPALSNFQMKYPAYDIEWAADEGNWMEVFTMINSGTALIENVKSR